MLQRSFLHGDGFYILLIPIIILLIICNFFIIGHKFQKLKNHRNTSIFMHIMGSLNVLNIIFGVIGFFFNEKMSWIQPKNVFMITIPFLLISCIILIAMYQTYQKEVLELNKAQHPPIKF